MASTRGAGGEGRWKLRDEQTSKTSSGTVAFLPPKWWSRIEIQTHRDPLTWQFPCSKSRRLLTPHLLSPQLRRSAAPERWRGQGSAPRRAVAEPEGEGGRRQSEASTRPPSVEESPTCQALRSGRAGPTVPMQRPALCSPAFQRTSKVTSSTETFRQKTQPRGRAASQTHSLQTLTGLDQPARAVKGCWRVSNSIQINKTKASPRCPFRKRAYLLHGFLSISGLPL